jgi:hypothetical protein
MSWKSRPKYKSVCICAGFGVCYIAKIVTKIIIYLRVIHISGYFKCILGHAVFISYLQFILLIIYWNKGKNYFNCKTQQIDIKHLLPLLSLLLLLRVILCHINYQGYFPSIPSKAVTSSACHETWPLSFHYPEIMLKTDPQVLKSHDYHLFSEVSVSGIRWIKVNLCRIASLRVNAHDVRHY